MESEVINDTYQYLSFKLKEEVFGIDVSQVREILDVIKITKIPQTPDFMCGVINLRGNVVTVVDMNMKLGMAKSEKTVNTCIVVVEVKHEDETIVLGVLVDSVQEVFEIEPADIEPAPKIGTHLKNAYIKGMGKRGDNFIIIIDADKIFSVEELAAVNAAKEKMGSETEQINN
jgi:Chemotaxis signal transduction protein